jgi:FkbM family methyltransferase
MPDLPKPRAGSALDELARLLALADARAYRSAARFARRHGVSPLAYPDACDANLDMLAPWVDPLSGVVVDIGANEGNWTAQLLRVFPRAEVIAAEPGPEPRAILEQRFADRPNVLIDPRAVSDTTGTAEFHVTRWSVFSSLLPPAAALHELYGANWSPTEELDTVQVDTVTFDELVGEQHVSVLKLDVQGAELAVLNGGREALQHTDCVIVEVLFVPHYEGDTTFPGIHAALAEQGFQLIDISRPFRDGDGDGPALWADACYARPPAA